MSKITFLFLLIFFPSIVYADDFFPSGQLDKNRYLDTMAFTISEVPDIGNCAGCIEYDISGLKGSYSDNIFSSIKIEDITYPDIHYGLVRSPRQYDTVSVPPLAKVDFIYLYKNDANGAVNITELGVFLGVSNHDGPYQLLDIDTEYRGVLFKLPTIQDMRYGNLKMYEGIGIVNKGASGSVVLGSAYVKSPLKFKNWKIEFSNGNANLKIVVENEGGEFLNNIEYEHKEFFLKRNFSAYEQYTYEYTLLDVNSDTLGYPSIFNGNVKMGCAVSGQLNESPMISNSAIVYGVREEGGVNLNYVSSRVKPWVESFCVTRLPYRMYAPKFFEEEEVIEESEAEVLGIDEKEVGNVAVNLSKLPQTGIASSNIFLPFFLVVIAILCYYHIRRLRK